MTQRRSSVRDYFDARIRNNPEYREAVEALEPEYEAMRSEVVLQIQQRRARETVLKQITVRELQLADVSTIVAAFAGLGWHKPVEQYERYLSEQETGARDVLVAILDDEFTGYVTILWESTYEPFRTAGIPEINDFNVLPAYRRQGIGSLLMDETEERISRLSDEAGIGVGMGPDYGAAQRLYTKRGYVADGRGLTSHGQHVRPGQSVIVDDDLVLYLTREL